MKRLTELYVLHRVDELALGGVTQLTISYLAKTHPFYTGCFINRTTKDPVSLEIKFQQKVHRKRCCCRVSAAWNRVSPHENI